MLEWLRRLGASALCVLAVLAFYTSLPLGWGAADAPDGTRYKVSPLGLSHVLTPHQTVSATEACRWTAASSSRLCALRVGAPIASLALRSVRYVMMLAALMALVGAAISAGPWRRRVRPWGWAAAPAAGALGAVFLFAEGVPRASVTLHALSVGVGGSLGTLQIAVAAGALLGFATATLPRPLTTQSAALATSLVALGTAAFLLQFPFAGGLGFAVASLAGGALLGSFVSAGSAASPRGHPLRPHAASRPGQG